MTMESVPHFIPGNTKGFTTGSYTILDGANVVASGETNASGIATFFLDAGTYYVRCNKSGYTFGNPDVEVVA